MNKNEMLTREEIIKKIQENEDAYEEDMQWAYRVYDQGRKTIQEECEKLGHVPYNRSIIIKDEMLIFCKYCNKQYKREKETVK